MLKTDTKGHILSVVQVSKSYGSHKVIDNISLDLCSGTALGLLGVNGAGKTTLMRMITNIIKPDEGSILWDGRRIADADRSHLGYLPEERGLYPKMKVLEQLCYMGRLKGLDARSAAASARRWLDRLALSDQADRMLFKLSKGMQQKVQLAATLLHNPDWVVLDEPFSGLDPVNAALLKEIVGELKKQGVAVLISSHNISLVEDMCDEVAILHSSHICYHDSIDAFHSTHSDSTLQQFFLNMVRPSE